ncbi:hypothetical protein D3C76_1282630 [compost metagenome]
MTIQDHPKNTTLTSRPINQYYPWFHSLCKLAIIQASGQVREGQMNRIIRLGFLILLVILLGVAVIYGISEQRNKQTAGSLGIDYVRKEYSVKDHLSIAAACHPFFGSGGYQVVLEDSHGEAYYLILMLGNESSLISVDDLTEDVRQGKSVFPCRS